jgi:hypothetical protein
MLSHPNTTHKELVGWFKYLILSPELLPTVSSICIWSSVLDDDGMASVAELGLGAGNSTVVELPPPTGTGCGSVLDLTYLLTGSTKWAVGCFLESFLPKRKGYLQLFNINNK